jgi:vacuolar-type H+-ATPase subunit I/STV1
MIEDNIIMFVIIFNHIIDCSFFKGFLSITFGFIGSIHNAIAGNQSVTKFIRNR